MINGALFNVENFIFVIMKEVLLKIPENRYHFFMELFKLLEIEVADKSEISDKQKALVRKRIKSSAAKDMIPWSKARKELKSKSQTSK